MQSVPAKKRKPVVLPESGQKRSKPFPDGSA